MKIQFQSSSFYKLLWIHDFLERFAEEFLVGRSLITNFGLTLLSWRARQSRTAGEELGGFVGKPENWAKTFPHKTGSKRNIKGWRKKLPLSKVFLDSSNSMQMLWKLLFSISICKGAFNCSSLQLQNSFANSKALLHFTFNCV